MKITAIKTAKVRAGDDLFVLLSRSIARLPEKSVVVIASKIVALSEGRIRPASTDKDALVKQESELYLARSSSKYDVMLTVSNGLLVPHAGIDESNSRDGYVLWPEDPWKCARVLRAYLEERYGVRNLGVLIADSRVSPLRWGTTGVALGWSGFAGLRNYIGKPDVFGRKLKMTKANIADGLAAAAVLVMGEGREQTPLALIEDAPVAFREKELTRKEIAALRIDMKDDLYAPLLTKANWKKGGKKSS